MSESRLTNLAILSIERQLSEKINSDTVIKDFAAMKARKSAILIFFWMNKIILMGYRISCTTYMKNIRLLV